MLRGLFQVSRLPSQGVLRHRDFAVPRLQVDREVHRLNQLQDSEMGVGLGSSGHDLARIEWISLPIWEICINMSQYHRQWGIEWNWQCVDRDIAWYQISPYLTLSHHISPYRVISSDLEWLKDTQGVSRVDDLDLIWDILVGLMWGTSRIDHSVVKSCWQLVRRSQLKRVSPWLGRSHRSRKSHRIGDHRWSPVIIGSNNFHRFPAGVSHRSHMFETKQLYVLIIFI